MGCGDSQLVNEDYQQHYLSPNDEQQMEEYSKLPGVSIICGERIETYFNIDGVLGMYTINNNKSLHSVYVFMCKAAVAVVEY